MTAKTANAVRKICNLTSTKPNNSHAISPDQLKEFKRVCKLIYGQDWNSPITGKILDYMNDDEKEYMRYIRSIVFNIDSGFDIRAYQFEYDGLMDIFSKPEYQSYFVANALVME
jgi:hypothetical protein